jgi:hypothetical protein
MIYGKRGIVFSLAELAFIVDGVAPVATLSTIIALAIGMVVNGYIVTKSYEWVN